MLELNLEPQKLNDQENFNVENTQDLLKALNSNNNTLTIYFQKIGKKIIIIVVVMYILIGGYASLLDQSLNGFYFSFFLIALVISSIMTQDRKIVLIKEPKTNTLIAKVYNYFRCRRKKKIFNFLSTAQFDIKKIQVRENFYLKLFIFNNLAHLPPIELEKDENKIKSLELFYDFYDLDQSKTDQEYINELNEFINSSQDFDSPLFFNANKYIYRNENYPNEKFSNDNQYFLSKIMRFSDYFYVYHVRNPNIKSPSHKCRNITLFIIINSILIAIMYAIAGQVLKIKETIFKILLSCCIPILSGLIIYFICICIGYKIQRIDCLFSSDFKKIFIGTAVKIGKAYKNTFEFQINEINKFYIRENYKKTFLSVTVSNNNIDICEISNKIDLDKFVLILNKKINKI